MSNDSTTRVTFLSDQIEIEGLLEEASSNRGAVITHPHPLYGGDMNNHVVEKVHQAFRHRGYTTLRFNFRGTGLSQGHYDDGIGEQIDLTAAVEFLLERGCDRIHLAGYSFGAWVIALTCQKKGWSWPVTLISPPVGFIDFDDVGRLSGLELVITGSDDDIAPPDAIRRMLPTWNPAAHFEIIDGSDHFYGGYFQQLYNVIDQHLDRVDII